MKFVTLRLLKRLLAEHKGSEALTVVLGTSRIASLGEATQFAGAGKSLNLFVSVATVEDYRALWASILKSGKPVRTVVLGIGEDLLGLQNDQRGADLIPNSRSSTRMGSGFRNALGDLFLAHVSDALPYLLNLGNFHSSVLHAYYLSPIASHGHEQGAELLRPDGSLDFGAAGFPKYSEAHTRTFVRGLARRYSRRANEVGPTIDANTRALSELISSIRAYGANVILFGYPMRARIRSSYGEVSPELGRVLRGLGADMARSGAMVVGEWPGQEPLCGDADFFDALHFNARCLQRGLESRYR